MSSPASDTRALLGEGWWNVLQSEFESPYFAQLKTFLQDDMAKHKIHPRGSEIFNAFTHTPFEKVRVVILGQDPYHGAGQAHGLCFSVPQHVPPPPSLQNIFKELDRDLGTGIPNSGNLLHWAAQGVLLLNTTLTVREGQAASHQGKGWERFTAQAIKALATGRKGIVFLLWGRSAQQHGELIDPDVHYLLKAPHPSPLSAHRGFIGCGHFSATNEILVAQGGPRIEWRS